MSKAIKVSLMASFGTMFLLYGIGYVANIEIFKFEVSRTHTEIALLPIALGLFVAFISDRIIKSKVQ